MRSRGRTPTLLRRTAAAGGGLVLTVLAAASAVPAVASARPLSGCTATAGVIVAVDFSHWGGPVLRSCGTTPTTGFALLNQGGWHTTGTEHDGPGFICRIGYTGYRHDIEYPTPSQQACVQTPPASAYWASWQARPGGTSWTYSQAGAMSYRPGPGSVMLWVFGSTNLAGTAGSARPAISPASLRAPPGTGAAPGRTPAIVNAPPLAAAAVSPAGGSARPTLLAVAIAMLLAAAGIGAVTRRRRTGQP